MNVFEKTSAARPSPIESFDASSRKKRTIDAVAQAIETIMPMVHAFDENKNPIEQRSIQSGLVNDCTRSSGFHRIPKPCAKLCDVRNVMKASSQSHAFATMM